MNYSFVPQKVNVELPVYKTACTKCSSNRTYPIMNMHGSPRICYECKNQYNPVITGYKTYVQEK